VDANILVCAGDVGVAQHAASHGLLEAARNPRDGTVSDLADEPPPSIERIFAVPRENAPARFRADVFRRVPTQSI
jgi:hypothetical protein